MANPNGAKNFPKDTRGNKNQSRTRPWKNAIKRTLKQYEDKTAGITQGNVLRRIAEEMVECALDRNNPNYRFAVKELGLRLDGKPTETVEIGDTTRELIGISAAYGVLASLTGKGEVIDGEVIVPDRSLLSSEVCVEAGGRGEGVDISED